MSHDPVIAPSTLTILPTYKCTAQCKECCFECSPDLRGRLSLEQILRRIDKAHAAFPFLKLVCFSGGECFTIGKDLDTAIAYAHGLALFTRCVSNGYWGSSLQAARKRVNPLAEAGLTELNLSTGDEHQEFVPLEFVINAAIEAASCNVRTLIVVEGSKQARFRKEALLAHPRLKEFFASECASNLRILENIWMSFHSESQFTHEGNGRVCNAGCSSIFDNIVATPSGQMASCCGLTMEHIPEMKIGDGDTDDFASLYESQFEDFLKVWIAVDGPRKILQFAAEKNPLVRITDASHICESCIDLYRNKEARETLQLHHEHKINDVLTRLYLVRAMRVNSASLPRPESELVPEMFGA